MWRTKVDAEAYGKMLSLVFLNVGVELKRMGWKVRMRKYKKVEKFVGTRSFINVR